MAEDVTMIVIEEAEEDVMIVMIAAAEVEMIEVEVGTEATPETEIATAEDAAGPTPATRDVIVAAAEDEVEARTEASPAAAVR